MSNVRGLKFFISNSILNVRHYWLDISHVNGYIIKYYLSRSQIKNLRLLTLILMATKSLQGPTLCLFGGTRKICNVEDRNKEPTLF